MSKHLIVSVLFLGILGLSACDRINLVREKIKGSSAKPVTVSAPEKTPVSVPSAVMPAANVLVSIGNWTMTKEEFLEKLKALKQAVPEFDLKNKQQVRDILDRLIEQRLFVAEAQRRELDKNKDLQMAIEEFRNTLLVQQLAAKVSEKVEATEEEAKDFFDKNTAMFVKEGQWKVREIVVPDEATAHQIATELSQGGDFAQIAQQKSKGKTAAEGGDLGSLKQFPFAAMANAVLSLNVGSVSAVVPGPEGFYLFKLEEKKGGEPLKFEEIKNDLKAELTNSKKEQAVMTFLEDLKKKEKIQINEKLLEE